MTDLRFEPLWRSRAPRLAALAALLGCAAYGFLPQFGGPGYEAALGAGLVLPALSALSVSAEVSGGRVSPFEAYARGVATGSALGVLGLLVSLLHGLRVGFCDALWGVELFLLGPLPGAVLGGVWGATAGLVAGARRTVAARRLAWIGGALLGPALGVLVSLWRFYSSPMVFAFDPFFGYFSGPLYDTVIDPLGALVSYRIGSALTLTAVAVAALHLERDGRGRLRPRWLGRPGLVLFGVIAALGSLGLFAEGPALGHYSTSSSIQQALGRRLSSRRCDVVYSSGLLERDVRLLARDCDASLGQVEAYLGVRGPEHVRVYLFANEGEKGRLMGASGTYIAKPWREEIYIQYAPYPHPVMQHELAHVVAGRFGRGPFRVSGPLAGLVPDPGRIEGVAVAAAPSENDDFTLDQWARALLELGLLPPLDRVFQLSFLGQNAAKAYAVAGDFVDYLQRRFGASVVRGWYSGEDLSELTHQPFSALEAEWRSALQKVELPPALLYAARVRFDRPAILSRICPRIVDRLLGVANQRLAADDSRGARAAYLELLALDPHTVSARLGLAACSLRAGDPARARQDYLDLATARDLARLEQAAAREAAADIDLQKGDVARARGEYAAVAEVVADEDHLRTLDVKRAVQGDLERRAIVDLLIGDPLLGPSWDVAAPELATWAERSGDDGLPLYLLGKNLYGRGRVRAAAAYLERALERRLDLPRVRREALRMQLIAACALGDRAQAHAALSELLRDAGLGSARRRAAEQLAERCGAR